jgi:hypothetical protein
MLGKVPAAMAPNFTVLLLFFNIGGKKMIFEEKIAPVLGAYSRGV